jgi:hypothetical protein
MPSHASFDETWMGAGDPLVTSSVEGFGSGNRVPGSSRVSRTAAKAAKRTGVASKGLSRSCVSVKWEGRVATVRLKGSLVVLGTLRTARGKGGNTFSYKLPTESRSHSGFPKAEHAIKRMLEKLGHHESDDLTNS